MFSNLAIIISGFGGDSSNLPAQEQAQELIAKTETYSSDFSAVAESETGGLITGIIGLGNIIKVLVIDAPKYAGEVITESFSFLNLPTSFSTVIGIIFLISVLTTGILLLRGVKS